MLKYGLTQGSVIGPFFFLIHTDDLNHGIKYCKVHHFADN